MNNQNRRALRRVELTEQENDVGDEDRLPNVIWARADSGNWIDYDPPALKWTKYYRSDYVDDMLEDAMQDAYKDGLKKGRRAARGDEPEQLGTSKWIPDEIRRDIGILLEFVEGRSKDVYGDPPLEVTRIRKWLDGQISARSDEPDETAERIAQLEADLKAADEEARKLRDMVCDEWRKDALSDEDAQILELGRLMRQVRDKENVDVELYLWNDGSECISVNGHRVDYVMMDKPIAYLRSRLQPQQRPTAESMIAELRNIKTTDDLWDWWQDTLEDWHAAGGDDDN